ncbi:hypothetical protein FA13DRAFT_51514 [Coprinellus micaceus]|uniref:Uncharacterized protein n=1 Tax=Coprinellus micaceus TaxID=71717 RepID=A0A4Y7U0W6_COPMI|nr:hypothetical protein FA13DRAFT_51514 [Coprinellus micaceus]
MKGAFRCLRRLSWHFDTTDVPTSLVVQFLEHTPTLRDLAVHGTTPALYRSSELFPPRFLTCLETLECPLDWAQVLVPGRPVGGLNIWAHRTQDIPKFLASTEAELDDLLRPLTMCPSLATLHLPHYPPLAPTELLMNYLAARFPLVHDLKIAAAGERVAFSNSFVCGLRGGPGMPEINSEEQVVEDGLLETLERDVREDVERILAAWPRARPKIQPPPHKRPHQDFRRGQHEARSDSSKRRKHRNVPLHASQLTLFRRPLECVNTRPRKKVL